MSTAKALKQDELKEFQIKANAPEVEVLLQKLGSRWYAFWEANGEIYFQLCDGWSQEACD
jgi:hypothetical protein